MLGATPLLLTEFTMRFGPKAPKNCPKNCGRTDNSKLATSVGLKLKFRPAGTVVIVGLTRSRKPLKATSSKNQPSRPQQLKAAPPKYTKLNRTSKDLPANEDRLIVFKLNAPSLPATPCCANTAVQFAPLSIETSTRAS